MAVSRVFGCGDDPPESAMRDLLIQPLTRETFSAYGEVLDIDGVPGTPINADRARRYNALAHPVTDSEGHLVISIVYSKAGTLPCELTIIERHPLSTQAFIPLQSQTMIVVVAHADTEPCAANLSAFMSLPGQGINYFAGTWHHPLLPLQSDGNFLVIDRNDPGHNCDVVTLDEAVRLRY